MLTSALRKMLLTLGYPKLEKSHHLVGPYRHVGALQVRIPDATNCQIFYPAVADTSKRNGEHGKTAWERRRIDVVVIDDE